MRDADERYHLALDWLSGRPDLEVRAQKSQTGALSLARPAALLEALGRPDRRFRAVLVAGTKGKGSTAMLIASALRAHGLRVGLYTQPHLHTYRERLRIDGELVSPEAFSEQVEALRPVVDSLDRKSRRGPLSTFEITTALGVRWFAEQAVDWAVLEVGLGGRLDATNVVDPTVAVITSISYDHTQILGRTLPKIAAEKAGIIKRGGLVVSAPQRPSAEAVVRRTARQRQAKLTMLSSPGSPRALNVRPLRFAADDRDLPGEPLMRFRVRSARRDYDGLCLSLGGFHQVVNAQTAIAALEAAEARGLTLDAGATRRGFAEARWPGRFELASTRPTLVLDGAHNADSAARLSAALEAHVAFERLHLVLGVFDDKDLRGILAGLAGAATLTGVRAPGRRGRPPEEIVAAAHQRGVPARAMPSVSAGIEAAVSAAGPRDVVCVTGSLALVGAAREVLGLAAERD